MLLGLISLISVSSSFASEPILQKILLEVERDQRATCSLHRPLPETGRGVCVVTDDFCLANEMYHCLDKNGELTRVKAVYSNGYGKVPVLKKIVVTNKDPKNYLMDEKKIYIIK